MHPLPMVSKPLKVSNILKSECVIKLILDCSISLSWSMSYINASSKSFCIWFFCIGLFMFFINADWFLPGVRALIMAGFYDDSFVKITLWLTFWAFLCWGLSPGLLYFDVCFDKIYFLMAYLEETLLGLFLIFFLPTSLLKTLYSRTLLWNLSGLMLYFGLHSFPQTFWVIPTPPIY